MLSLSSLSILSLLAAVDDPIELGSTFSGLLRTIAGLTVLVVVALYLFRAQRRATRPNAGRICIVESRRLEARRQLHLVRVDGIEFLVGSCDAGVASLAQLPPSSTPTFVTSPPATTAVQNAPSESKGGSFVLRR